MSSKLRNTVFVGAGIVSSLIAAKAVDAYELIKANFHNRPVDTTDFYGSGDLPITEARKMASGEIPFDDRADVTGDGVIDENDVQALEDHINNGATLPSDWENQDIQGRRNWAFKTAEIDGTSEIPYNENDWFCNQFTRQTKINMSGIPEPSIANLAQGYDRTHEARFNIPVQEVIIERPGEIDHRFNGILIGNDPKNWDDWLFIEPQNDQEAKPGDWNLPYGSKVKINGLIGHFDHAIFADGYYLSTLATFQLDGQGIPTLTNYEEDFIADPNDIVSIASSDRGLPERASLSNHPNPFNPSTTIDYEISEPGPVNIEIYNSIGQLVRTLVDKEHARGTYHINWDGTTDLGLKAKSGVHFYTLQTPSERIKGKMTLMQ